LLGGADSHVVGIYLRVQGSIGANILFVLPIDNARLLVDMLMAVPSGSTRDFGEIELSALQEVGNIVAATYLNAMVMFTQLKMVPSVPVLGIDMAGAILDAILAQFGEVGDYVLVLETKFRKDRQDVVGQFFLLPEPGSLDTILSALGVSN